MYICSVIINLIQNDLIKIKIDKKSKYSSGQNYFLPLTCIRKLFMILSNFISLTIMSYNTYYNSEYLIYENIYKPQYCYCSYCFENNFKSHNLSIIKNIVYLYKMFNNIYIYIILYEKLCIESFEK